MARVFARVAVWVALALVAGLATGLAAHTTSANAAAAPGFVAVGHSPTQGTPVPGAYLTADLGTWSSVPESYEFQWLRDGVPIAGAAAQDYLVQAADIGHALAPKVTGHWGRTPLTSSAPPWLPASSVPRSPSTSGGSTRPPAGRGWSGWRSRP